MTNNLLKTNNNEYTNKDPNLVTSKLSYIVASQKKAIYKENKGKSGIYRFICETTGKSYIGSAVNLRIRFNEPFLCLFARLLFLLRVNLFHLNYTLDLLQGLLMLKVVSI